MKDISKLAAAAGISVTRLKYAFGIALVPCTVTTVEEASAAFDNSPPMSEAQYAAYERWDELSHAQANAATTIAEIKNAYVSAPSQGDAIGVILFKWIRFSTTIDELNEVEKSMEVLDLGLEDELMAKRNQLAIAMIAAATTFEEAVAVYKIAPPGWEAEYIAIFKLYELFQE